MRPERSCAHSLTLIPPAAVAMGRAGLLGVLLLGASVAAAGPPPPSDWEPVVVQPAGPVVIVEPVPVPAVVYARPVVLPQPVPPQPLPTVLRVAYAPFYVAGLTIRYGFYYGIVVPLEVFGRALAYGFEGGVADPDGKSEGK
jgi:hypothetical protein